MEASHAFIQALQQNDKELIKKVPKADLHNHSLLSIKNTKITDTFQVQLLQPKKKFRDIHDMNAFIRDNYLPFILKNGHLKRLIALLFIQAREDGIVYLESSFDCYLIKLFPKPEMLTKMIDEMHQMHYPQLNFVAELGMPREETMDTTFYYAEKFIDTGYFKSIDLYGDELARPAKEFKPIYRKAEKMGLKLKAHAGEFGTAESIKETVEALNATIIQHGITASNSDKIMQWIADHKIQLNICPTSNIMLSRVADIANHPIRVLHDRKIKVTINTDDLLLFNSDISQEYFKLYHSGLFNAKELDTIRKNGLP